VQSRRQDLAKNLQKTRKKLGYFFIVAVGKHWKKLTASNIRKVFKSFLTINIILKQD
jgi:hypothetical protein